MSDSSLSLDLEQEASPPKPTKSRKKGAGKRSAPTSRKIHRSKAAPSLDKDALRRHKALEQQYDKARQAASASLDLDSRPLQSAPPVAMPSTSTSLPPDASPACPSTGVQSYPTQPLTMAKGFTLHAGHFSCRLGPSASSSLEYFRGHLHSDCQRVPCSGSTISRCLFDFQTMLSMALPTILVLDFNKPPRLHFRWLARMWFIVRPLTDLHNDGSLIPLQTLTTERTAQRTSSSQKTRA